MKMELLLAHRWWKEFGFWENTILWIKESLKKNFDIIEVDVRKSKDGFLYCYHWNLREILFYKRLLKTRNLEYLKKQKNVILLEDVFEIVWNKASIFIDIKEYDILNTDLEKIIKKYTTKKIYISSFNVKKLIEISKLKIKNNNINTVYYSVKPLSIRKKYETFDIVQLHHWNINRKIIEKNIKIAINPFFLSKRKYTKTIKKLKWKLEYIHTDMIKL